MFGRKEKVSNISQNLVVRLLPSDAAIQPSFYLDSDTKNLTVAQYNSSNWSSARLGHETIWLETKACYGDNILYFAICIVLLPIRAISYLI